MLSRWHHKLTAIPAMSLVYRSGRPLSHPSTTEQSLNPLTGTSSSGWLYTATHCCRRPYSTAQHSSAHHHYVDAKLPSTTLGEDCVCHGNTLLYLVGLEGRLVEVKTRRGWTKQRRSKIVSRAKKLSSSDCMSTASGQFDIHSGDILPPKALKTSE